MNKKVRLSKSGIEYLDYQWGIFSGCENWAYGICPVPNCWARSLAYRFPNHYPDGFNPHYYPEAIDSPKHLKKPSIIGVGWVGDVIGYGLAYKEQIFGTIEQCPRHTFLFLTKNADQLIKWGKFPENCWVGVTATDRLMWFNAIWQLQDIKATVKFLSFEPLLKWQHLEKEPIDTVSFTADWFRRAGISWLIIGAQTKPTVYPKIEWVEEIVRACDKAGVKVFLKDNLLGMDLPYNDMFFPYECPGSRHLRQEMPK